MTELINNRVKRDLKAGRQTVGGWLHLCSSISAEIMGDAGFDWLLIDMEHGPGDYQTLLVQLQALSASRTTPVVRVQWNDPAVIKRVLDLGAEGVMIPLVGNRRECEAAVRACKYPPEGTRGVAGSHRAAGFGRFSADYWARANAEILVIVQVETPEAVKVIDDIVTVPGVDRRVHRPRGPVRRARPPQRPQAPGRAGGDRARGGGGQAGRRRPRHHQPECRRGDGALRPGLSNGDALLGREPRRAGCGGGGPGYPRPGRRGAGLGRPCRASGRSTIPDLTRSCRRSSRRNEPCSGPS